LFKFYIETRVFGTGGKGKVGHLTCQISKVLNFRKVLKINPVNNAKAR